MRAQGDEGIPQPTPTDYNSAWHLRCDLWASIGDWTRRMTRTPVSASIANSLRTRIEEGLALLETIETYWAYPGREHFLTVRHLCEAGDFESAARIIEPIVRRLSSQSGEAPTAEDAEPMTEPSAARNEEQSSRPAFQVLVVDALGQHEANAMREDLRGFRRPEDPFTYELLIVPSFEDALVAVLLNSDIQACILRPGFAVRSLHDLEALRKFLWAADLEGLEALSGNDLMLELGERIARQRPELDLYLVAQASVERIAGALTRRFRRIFHRQDSLELHLSILAGVEERNVTPFFTALRGYSRQPTGVFHALPISRGRSVVNSPWIRQLSNFYGLNIFLAETSATSGGLDSLLEPAGALKQSQELAARAFGAHQTFFVTNGTSTGNKIVVQSIIAPGDVVLVDRNCHKSHHYALMLAGARVSYLDAYSLDAYSIYGAVPLEAIKERLLEYERAGRLHEVKMLSLTNCTFDGIVYDVERVMEECLAIKPDLVFLWDEAWFAFAGFHPIYRGRTAMAAAQRLQQRYRSQEYAEEYARSQSNTSPRESAGGPGGPERRLPDPGKVRLRVYATQSTHKTLTALRQGSMIHVFDEDFNSRNWESFRDAYMTHTSTSPNYQILASLDVGRQQAELEGFHLVQRQAELAMNLYDVVQDHPIIRRYFRFLSAEDLIPEEFRQGSLRQPPSESFALMHDAWSRDEFVCDPSRLTLSIGASGVDGDTFKHTYLMDRYGIQVNKTSRNTVLFMTNIGTTRSSIAYLIEVLVKLAEEFDDQWSRLGPLDRQARENRVAALTSNPPPLPDFSRFAAAFRPPGGLPDGDIRAAYFKAYDPDACEYLRHEELTARVDQGEEIVSAMFVTPYPPGFPVLVPGQVVTMDVLQFMARLDTREIHGYFPEFGYRVFKSRP